MGNICCCSYQGKYLSSHVVKRTRSETSSEASSSFEFPKLSFLPRPEEKVRVFENTQILCGSQALIKSARPGEIDSSKSPLAFCLLSSLPDAEKVNFIGHSLRAERSLTREKVLNLFKDLFEVAVDFFPSLALQSRDSFGKKEILNYQNILRTQKQVFLSTQVAWAMQGESSIPADELLAKLRFMDWLLTPRKLRENILDGYITLS